MALTQARPALQYSEGRSKPWSGSRLINAFAEKGDGDKAVDFAVMSIPGLDLAADIAASSLRSVHFMGNLIYAVVGQTLYSIDQAMTATALGTILGSGTVTMADNGTQLGICAAPNGYVYSGGTIQSPPGLPMVSDITYVDSYFIWTVYNSDQCIFSGIADGLSYDALDVFTAEGAPDGLLGLVTDHRDIHLFGTQTIEIFYNTGDNDNPFQRQGNAFIEKGCFDRDSVVKVDNSIQFMGANRIVYRLDGYSPVRISTHAIEYQLRNSTYARGFTYTQEGHIFYCLTTDNGTFCYDLATGAWHKRQSWNMDVYRVGFAVTAWNQTYLGDSFTGKLYRPNLDRNDENGEPIAVIIDIPQLGDGVTRRTCYVFQMDIENGVGLNDGQGSDPVIMMRYSKDGGRTYSNELWRSMGKMGEYLSRAIWRALGQFYKLDISVTITDPVRKMVLAYWVDIR